MSWIWVIDIHATEMRLPLPWRDWQILMWHSSVLCFCQSHLIPFTSICISFRTESDLDKVVRKLKLKFNMIILKKIRMSLIIPADGSLCCHRHMQNWPLGHVDLCQRAEGGRHVFLNPSEHLTVGREPDNVYSGQTGLWYKELKWSKWRAGFFNKLF